MLYKYMKYITGTGITGSIELLITIFLTELFNFWYIHSYAFALFVGSIILFFFHRHITFKAHHIRKRTIVKFWSILGAIYILNLTILYLLSKLTDYLISYFNITNSIIINYNYILLIIIVAIPFSYIGFILSMKHIFHFKDLLK